jgi:hypothetical protein
MKMPVGQEKGLFRLLHHPTRFQDMGNAIVEVRISNLLVRADEMALIGHTVLLDVTLFKSQTDA